MNSLTPQQLLGALVPKFSAFSLTKHVGGSLGIGRISGLSATPASLDRAPVSPFINYTPLTTAAWHHDYSREHHRLLQLLF
jgi:hypothetical protein